MQSVTHLIQCYNVEGLVVVVVEGLQNARRTSIARRNTPNYLMRAEEF